MDNWRLNRIKAVEENIFAWGYAVDHADVCSSEIPEVENAMIHAVSYMQYPDRINKISLYESRLSRVIARNTEVLEKRQVERRKSQPQTQTAAVAYPPNQPLTATNGFDQNDSPSVPADIPKAA